jgi:hypothetical protein
MKKNLMKLIGGLVLLISVVAASAQETWYFYQSGWTKGGVASGSFTGTDANGDGQLSSFDGEVANLSISMTGNRIVPDGYTWDQSNLWGIVYDINGEPFLGDGQTGEIEGFSVHDSSYNYFSGYGPNDTPGGGLYDSSRNLLDLTLDPIMVSTTPITEEIYQENLVLYNYPAPVPEPTTLTLAALGGLGLLLFRRRE